MKKHILSIDDEADIRELLQEVLTMKGYRVSTAATGAEALKIIKADPPQLVISDFQIEDADGFVLTEEIKRLLPDVPILLLTGAVFDPEVVRDTIKKKVTSYLDKTATLDTIVKEIQRLAGDGPGASANK